MKFASHVILFVGIYCLYIKHVQSGVFMSQRKHLLETAYDIEYQCVTDSESYISYLEHFTMYVVLPQNKYSV